MIVEQLIHRTQAGLLVSVRSAGEALAAVAGGADVIDVKEPERGALGAADWETMAEVVKAVDRRLPVTAAAGELLDLLPLIAAGRCRPMPDGISLCKIGLAGCGPLHNWARDWQGATRALCGRDRSYPQPVAVIYADWRLAQRLGRTKSIVPRWTSVAAPFWSTRRRKSVGSLFDHWPRHELSQFIERARGSGCGVVLAGSLSGSNLLAAAELRPSLVAVRGAACEAGGTGHVSQLRVAALTAALRVDSQRLLFSTDGPSAGPK